MKIFNWRKTAVRLALSSAGPRRNNEEETPWEAIQDASTKDILLKMLKDIYWHGVEREMTHLIRSLVEWQDHFSSVVLHDESDDNISGFDTFIDSLNQNFRASADEYAKAKSKGSYEQAERVLQETAGYRESTKFKDEVAAIVKGRRKWDIWERRAKMLLQSAGWLDIDKLIEYREPPDNINILNARIWNKPRVPQFSMDGLNQNLMPNFVPLQCSLCEVIIRGIMFKCTRDCSSSTIQLAVGDVVCEECTRCKLNESLQGHCVKHYKHCILDDVITPSVARRLCSCLTVRRYDTDGKAISLFPVDPAAEHRKLAASQVGRCKLFTLGDSLAEEKHRQLQENRNIQNSPFMEKSRVRPLRNLQSKVEDSIDGGVPLPVRKFLEEYTLGNSHISLMIGPLIIENGARLRLPNAHNGVLITYREPHHLQAPNNPDPSPQISIALSEERTIFTQARNFRERRLKACMKQVVSGAFSGFLDESLESQIPSLMVKEAKAYGDLNAKHPTKPRKYFDMELKKAVERLLEKIKPLLMPRIYCYLDLITTKLFDPEFPLKWDVFSNNCQKFCDGLLSYNVFGGVFAGSDNLIQSNSIPTPLYLISFVCRPGSYIEQRARTKYDVPKGLTEEYLLKFRYGRHDDADIVDTLQEYWYDFGNFRGPLYKYQDIFPWDCTEGYNRNPTKCNDCNISKHVWGFPFDSWSTIHLHLQKDRRWYPPTSEGELRLTDGQWMENRLRLLLAQDVLIEGAIAIRSQLKDVCGWLSNPNNAMFDRVRLGGIHRAQPCSHYYERGRFSEAYVAPWIHLKREDRIAAYEKIRDYRQKLPDIISSRTDGGSGDFPGWESDYDGDIFTDGFIEGIGDMFHDIGSDFHDIGSGFDGSGFDGLGFGH